MIKPVKTSSPTRSRDKVLQTLYELEVGGQELKEVLKNYSSEKSNPFYQDMLKGVITDQVKIDKIVEKNLDRPFEQLDPIERNALRIGLYELINQKVDPAIAINESIRISKKYGSIGGYKLVNAVLDKVVKENQI
ncbi:MAG: transcription antitermination factor NusB [SAR86 cluster bacterium]|nr:transcription antitermination factor NusB [SAR86 cluster bacterium]